MKTKILLEAKGINDILEDIKLQVEGSHASLEELLVEGMEQSERFYEIVKNAIILYEEKGIN